MTNNDVLRRIRYIFNFNDEAVMGIFSAAECEVTRQEMSDWLKKEDDSAFVKLSDRKFATFLNGLINTNRGKKDGPQAKAESELTNNIIFRKLNIALNLKSEQVIEVLALADFQLSNHELSAFFRKKGHKHYRECNSQILRNYLKGLQLKHRA